LKKSRIFVFVSIFIFSISVTSAAVQREGLLQKASRTVDALFFIRSEIDNKYQTFVNAETVASLDAAKNLPLLEAEINTLSAQLKTFDQNIDRENSNLLDLQDQIKSIQLELADFEELAEMREVELARSRDVLDEFIRVAYSEAMQYTDWKTGEISTLKFLFTDENLAEVETRKVYLDILQKVSASLIRDLQEKQSEFSAIKNELLAKRGELILLQQEIIDRKKGIEKMRVAKQTILTETRGQESQYRKLVEESRRQQVEALAEIKELKAQLGVIDRQLKAFQGDLGEAEFAELLKGQSIAGANGFVFPNHTPQLIWPANPGRGITAYFLDSGYKARFGIAHHAIDFRLAQGSRVNSAGPGIVYKAQDSGGTRYSYITIAHVNGLATTYGHISKILVEEGDFIQAGDLIGLSGGMPGTRGAGYITTGPHLHFEVIENGENQNPLDYLPLEKMRLEDIPQKYLEDAVKL